MHRVPRYQFSPVSLVTARPAKKAYKEFVLLYVSVSEIHCCEQTVHVRTHVCDCLPEFHACSCMYVCVCGCMCVYGRVVRLMIICARVHLYCTCKCMPMK